MTRYSILIMNLQTKYPRVLDFCCFWLTVTYSSFHSFMKDSCTYYVIFGIIGTRDTIVKKTDKFPALMELISRGQRQTNAQN